MVSKVLVVYHKKDKLFKNKHLFPIHAGRSIASENLKAGKLSNEVYEWLCQNMEGDDTGDNISNKNRYLNETTATYWAWKNYNEIGNPDFIGLNHYRRFFKINYSRLDNYLEKYELIYLAKPAFKEGCYKHYKENSTSHNYNEDGIDKLINTYKLLYPDDFDNFIRYLKEPNDGGFMNMFVMKKEDFFTYCNLVFPVVKELEKCITKENRTIGMLVEVLTSYYLYKLEKIEGRKTLKTGLSDVPPMLSAAYILSQIFNLKQFIRANGKRHLKVTILGIKFNIRML